ncbi:MAG: hypothetical protein ACOYJC_10010 [Christensenellales bacterium]|jgi:preprotein translocase subunit SecF
MKKRIRICLMLSVALIIVGILVGLLAGFRFGTEYRAGERMVIDFAEDFSSAKVDAAVKRAGVEASPVEKITKNKIYQGVISIKYQDDMESARNRVIEEIAVDYPATRYNSYSFQGSTHTYQDMLPMVYAVLIAAGFIFLYMLARHRVKNALRSVILPLHDCLLTFAIAMVFRLEINHAFVTALLFVLAGSVFFAAADISAYRRRASEAQAARSEETPMQIAERMLKTSRMRHIAVWAGVLVLSVVLFLMGNAYLQTFAAVILIGAVVVTYTQTAFTLPCLALEAEHAQASKTNKRSKRQSKPR